MITTMDRGNFSVKSKGGTGQPDSKHSSMRHNYLKDTDNEIFALGDAASQLNDVNLDDLFAKFGEFKLSRFEGNAPESATTGLDGANGLLQKAYEQTEKDGTHVKAKVIEGPQYQSKTVTITKSVQPNESTEQNVILQPNGPITNNLKRSTGQNNFNQSITSSGSVVRPLDTAYQSEVKHLKPDTVSYLKRNSGSYDNFHSSAPRVSSYYMSPDMQETSLCEGSEEDRLLPHNSNTLPWDENEDDSPPFPLLPDDSLESAPMIRIKTDHDKQSEHEVPEVIVSDEIQEALWKQRNHIASDTPKDDEAIIPPPVSKGFDIKRKLSQHFKLPLKLSSRRPSATDSGPSSPKEEATEAEWSKDSVGLEDIQWYEPREGDQLGDTHDETVSVNMSCMACQCTSLTLSSPNKKKKKYSPKGPSKSGMMMAMKPGSDLPGLHALVANYAKMLYHERSEFVDTLFRAVKLNKVDVVKILCKIVSKSDVALSSHDLREPESSATILHVALLYNHEEMIEFLLSLKDPDLILAKYETDEYRNQTGLHVAVANGDVKVIENLLLALQGQERQVLINTIANGHYFKTRHPHGQLCLTAAAWAGHYEVVKVLVKHGGNMRLKNSMGNTLLHSIIIQSATYPDRNDYEELFKTIWEAAYVKAETLNYDSKSKEHRRFQEKQMQVNIFKQLLSIRNHDGYTPLALATTLLSPLLAPMLNLEKIYKIPQNKLGSIAWVTYDVTDITSFAQQRYNKFSTLHILAHNGQLLSRGADPNRNDDTDVFGLEPIRTILENKWSVYRWVYIMWCFIHLFYMVLFTACTIEANSSPHSTKGVGPSRSLHVRWWLIIFTLLPAMYIILEILDLFGNRPFRIQYMSNQIIPLRLIKCVRSEWTIIGNGPYRMVGIGFACFNLQWFLLYASEDPNQDIALAMSLLLGWIFVLFFTRGCRVTCRFSIMIQNLFLSDLIYFLTVYSIVLIGFSFAMNAMFTYIGNADLAISRVFYDMMNVVTDLDRKQSTDESRHPLFTKLLLIVYAIVAVILLLNMLIAMMNTSYEIVTVTRCNLWKQQQLSIMLMIERRFFWLKWLPLKSEQDMWSEGEDEDTRYFLDVTMLHSSKRPS